MESTSRSLSSAAVSALCTAQELQVNSLERGFLKNSLSEGCTDKSPMHSTRATTYSVWM